MTKNTEYEISLFEILRLLKHKWKLVCVISLACIVICGGYKIMTGSGGTQNVPSYDDYEKDAELYGYLVEAGEEQPGLLMEELENVISDRLSNPIFSVDPYNCEYEQIIIRFKDEDSNHDWAVSNWINKVDNTELFGEQEESLSDYKTILVPLRQGASVQGQDTTIPVYTSETAVQVIAVNGFDIKKAADYLTKQFNHYASEEGIAINKISRTTFTGYNDYVEKYQKNNRENYNSIYNTIANNNYIKSYIAAPMNPANVQKAAIKGVIKFCLIGLILGLVLAFVYILLDVIRKREIISTEQVEDCFDLELLSDCSADDELSLEVLNANLDVMTEKHSTIVVIAEDFIEGINETFSEWTKKSDRTFILCTDIFDDPESIESLKNARGIVIGIKIGKSKMDQIQNIIMKVNKFDLNVLGYVLL